MQTTQERIDNIFSYHTPSEDDIISYKEIRSKAKELAKVIDHYCPRCADQSAAMRKLRECVMTANASIALKGVS